MQLPNFNFQEVVRVNFRKKRQKEPWNCLRCVSIDDIRRIQLFFVQIFDLNRKRSVVSPKKNITKRSFRFSIVFRYFLVRLLIKKNCECVPKNIWEKVDRAPRLRAFTTFGFYTNRNSCKRGGPLIHSHSFRFRSYTVALSHTYRSCPAKVSSELELTAHTHVQFNIEFVYLEPTRWRPTSKFVH